ncbi:MAG: bifunctional nicotinamidase/pyrazinamidase [Burkholderiaceae bacterium]|nr:bifunctional nicotinamidase/pyrazinamidase [Burkholderiaceae bacterium]
MEKQALILVDIQSDFLPGGALAVPQADAILPIVGQLVEQYKTVVATQDWHPSNHESFAANHPGHKPGDMIELYGLKQVLWPVHCVQNTPGAQLSEALSMHEVRISKVFRKGTDPKVDSYSGFFDNGRRNSTGMGEWLKTQGIKAVSIVGLATDYCVKFTALDAVQLGFQTTVVSDACRAVNLRQGDAERAFNDMRLAGVQVLTSQELAL